MIGRRRHGIGAALGRARVVATRVWAALPLLTALGVVASGAHRAAHAGPPGPVAAARVTARDLGDRLRMFARPGDVKLANGQVTAVVRARDGWLVDLWRDRAILPSSRQLGADTEIDAIWKFFQIVTIGQRRFPVVAEQVTPLADGVRTDGYAEVGSTRYRAVTTYRLDPRHPRLEVTTELSVPGAERALGPVGIGDAVKWGNQQFWVEGVLRPRMKHRGRARWIGRRGAGGDLLLRSLESARMLVDYTTRRRGFSGTIAAVYGRVTVPVGGAVTVRRELSFEPLPVAARPEPASVGTLQLQVVDEHDQPQPAKIRIDRQGRKAPLFDDDGDLYGAYRFMWTGNGQLSRELEPGRYALTVSCGPERDLHRTTVEIRAGQTSPVRARLARVVTTPGWIAADLHLHQSPSVDAGVSIPQRLVSIAAEGVEFAVATDHYVVTDLGPTVRKLRDAGVLAVPLNTMAGTEVSTLGNRFGHFNVFPLRTDQNVKYHDTTAPELFADARRQSPGGVLQVNHPRFEPAIGYFSYFGVDDVTGTPLRAGYDPGFDSLEVYNGDDARDVKRVRRVLVDYMHLLGLGHRYTATGGSDSHKLAFLDPGLPRTLIHYGSAGDDARDVDATHPQILEALKAGRVVVTSGPFIEATVAGHGPGETARGVGQRTKLHVVIRAAPWIDVAQIEILEGGRARQVHWARVPRTGRVLRLDRDFDVTVGGKTFFVVVVQGARGLPNVASEHIVPFAFTNPIWVEP